MNSISRMKCCANCKFFNEKLTHTNQKHCKLLILEVKNIKWSYNKDYCSKYIKK